MIKTIETVLGPKDIDIIEHPKFGRIPKTVFKYREWGNDYHKKVLTDSEVYLAPPSEFNDPFDCGIDVAYHLLQTDEKLRKDYFQLAVQRHNSHFTIDQQIKEVDRLIAEKRYMDDEYMYKKHQQSRDALNEKFGLFCVTPVPDNILMWSHYSKSHKGFCVGFDSNKLFSFIGGRGCEVFYRDKYPEISPLMTLVEQMVHQTNSKAKFWNYEIEFRIMKQIDNTRVFKLPSNTINQVILGCSISNEHKDEIITIVKEKHPFAKLLQALPKKRAFDLEIIAL